MRNLYFLLPLLLLLACNKDDESGYSEVSPVVIDLAAVPYATLSEYHFFSGDLNAQQPSIGVLTYKPASELFTDHASKSRFIYVPDGQTATWSTDASIFELPVGSALVKTFFYTDEGTQHQQRIIETRLLIRKADGWITANYLWNDTQTEAYLQQQGTIVPISRNLPDGSVQEISYAVPSQNNCATCHNFNGSLQPIGIKPQNLDYVLSGNKNQLQHWTDAGFLASKPSVNLHTVDYKDVTQNTSMRVRSYFDANCAHCHRSEGSASYVNLQMAFELTTDAGEIGLCQGALSSVPGIPHGFVIDGGNAQQSVLHYMMGTNSLQFRMPRLGRTVVDEDALTLVSGWINSLEPCN